MLFLDFSVFWYAAFSSTRVLSPFPSSPQLPVINQSLALHRPSRYPKSILALPGLFAFHTIPHRH
jgi:hypothetical protein